MRHQAEQPRYAASGVPRRETGRLLAGGAYVHRSELTGPLGKGEGTLASPSSHFHSLPYPRWSLGPPSSSCCCSLSLLHSPHSNGRKVVTPGRPMQSEFPAQSPAGHGRASGGYQQPARPSSVVIGRAWDELAPGAEPNFGCVDKTSLYVCRRTRAARNNLCASFHEPGSGVRNLWARESVGVVRGVCAQGRAGGFP